MSKWQDGGSWKEWFEITGADGVDFHPIAVDPSSGNIFSSYTKEQMLSGSVAYPRSGYTFWKKINGDKYYISLNPVRPKEHKISIIADLEYIMGYLKYGHKEGTITLTEDEFRKFQHNPKLFLEVNRYLDDLTLIVDDYSVEDTGSVDSVRWKEI